MKSPLNIDETVKRYGPDEEMKTLLEAFNEFIWQESSIESVEQLVAFEKEYQRLGKGLDLCYDFEIEELGCVEMENGPMDLLCKGRFQQFSKGLGHDEVSRAFLETGLSELETLVIESFRADLSEMYRLDAYYAGIPPFSRSLCNVLNNALSKLPVYDNWVVRACNDYYMVDFAVGDVFSPGFCLTTSADLSWQDTSKNRYRIKPLTEGKSKAMAMFMVNNNTEYQVTFLEDVRFKVTAINEWGEGKREIVMEEMIANTEEKALYHISDQKYAPGEVVSIGSFTGTTRYHQGLSDENKGIDDYLSDGRPDGEPCRSHCLYAFDKLEYCIYFRNKELKEGKEYHLYKCKMNNSKGHPMILVGRLCSASTECRERLKEEYWKPTRNWHFLEYLSESIEIQEEIPLEKELQVRSINCGKVKYIEDYEKASYLLAHK